MSILKRGDIRADGWRFWRKGTMLERKAEFWLPPAAFEKALAKADAYHKAYREKNRKKAAERTARWRLKNKKKLLAYREANKERARAYNAAYRKAHPERLWCNKPENKEKRKKMVADWRDRNPDAVLEYRNRRRVRRKSADAPSFETRFLYRLCRAITNGSGIKHHVDHVIPISKGGSHSWDNLRIVPAVVNLRKGDRLG